MKKVRSLILSTTGRYIFLSVCVFAVCFGGGNARCQQTSIPAGSAGIMLDEFSDARDMMDAYLINPLDRLIIVVYAGERKIDEIEEFIKSDGTVYLPFLEKDVKIGGLRILEAEDVLEKLARSFIKEPRIVISVLSSYSQTVSTYGRIANMDIELRTPMRILQLIAKAGGPMTEARTDSIRVISMDGSIKYFNYDRINRHPTEGNNFFLQPGDIVFIPGIDDYSVMVLGEVPRPGTFSMKTGDKLLDALIKAGSWTTTADIENVRLLRFVGGRKVDIKEIDVRKIFEKGEIAQNFILHDGDIIFVPAKRAPVYVESIRSIVSLMYTILTSYVVINAIK